LGSLVTGDLRSFQFLQPAVPYSVLELESVKIRANTGRSRSLLPEQVLHKARVTSLVLGGGGGRRAYHFPRLLTAVRKTTTDGRVLPKQQRRAAREVQNKMH
jgi:hypothetical protein